MATKTSSKRAPRLLKAGSKKHSVKTPHKRPQRAVPEQPHSVVPRTKEPETVHEFLHGIAERASQLPPEVRAKIPRDASENLDHYLYGHPKAA